jgi:hypothetical protein
VVDCQHATPNAKTGSSTPNKLVTGIAHLDLERENLFSFSELVIVQNTVNGGIVYYPYVNKIAS